MTINIPVVVLGIGVVVRGTRVVVSGEGFIVLGTVVEFSGTGVVVSDPTLLIEANKQCNA